MAPAKPSTKITKAKRRPASKCSANQLAQLEQATHTTDMEEKTYEWGDWWKPENRAEIPWWQLELRRVIDDPEYQKKWDNATQEEREKLDHAETCRQKKIIMKHDPMKNGQRTRAIQLQFAEAVEKGVVQNPEPPHVRPGYCFLYGDLADLYTLKQVAGIDWEPKLVPASLLDAKMKYDGHRPMMTLDHGSRERGVAWYVPTKEIAERLKQRMGPDFRHGISKIEYDDPKLSGDNGDEIQRAMVFVPAWCWWEKCGNSNVLQDRPYDK